MANTKKFYTILSSSDVTLTGEIRRLADDYFFDYSDGIFKVSPLVSEITTYNYPDNYTYNISDSRSVWNDGSYCVTFRMSGIPTCTDMIDISSDEVVTFNGIVSEIITTIEGSDSRDLTDIWAHQSQVEITPETIWGYTSRTLTDPTLNSGTLATAANVTSSTTTVSDGLVSAKTELASDILVSQGVITSAITTATATLAGSDSIDMTELWAHQIQAEITPASIWSYGSRTLTEYAPATLWGYANRTLTDLGSDIAADLWTYSNRSLTTEVLSDGSHLTLAEGIKGLDATYDKVQALEGYTSGNAYSIQVYELGTTNPLPAKGVIRNAITGISIQISTAGDNGNLYYTVGDGTYKLWMQLWSYTWSNPYTLVISDGIPSPATVYGTPFSPNATYPDCATVYGTLSDFRLSFKQDIPIVIHADVLPQFIDDVLLVNNNYTVLSDSEGYFEFYAIKGSTIQITIENSGVDTTVIIPNQDSCRLIDLL